MIPSNITDYLERHGVEFERIPHPRAVTAQELAESIHVSGDQVGKVVVVEADGIKWMAVIPASHLLEEQLVEEALGAKHARMCGEEEFAPIFENCEAGAEPPFGHLFGMGVLLDAQLNEEEDIVFRAGSHSDALRMSVRDFRLLEDPLIVSVSSEPHYAFMPAGEGATTSP